MADFNWDDYPTEDKKDINSFDWDAHPSVDLPPEELAPPITVQQLNNVPGYSAEGLPPSMVTTPSEKMTSALAAAERGAEQGLSMGFSDELRGGLEAIPGAIQGEGDLVDLYRQYRDIERAKLKGLQKEHPYVYGGAELLSGAVVPGMGMGAGVSVAKAAGRGMLSGGLSGLGTSEGDLTKGKIAPAVIATGFGAGLGGGLGALGGMLSKAAAKEGGATLAKESDFLTKARQAVGWEKKKDTLTSSDDRDRLSKAVADAAKFIKKGFDETEEKAGKALGQVYKEAQESGLNLKDPVVNEMVRLKQELQNLADDITIPDRKAEVLKTISDIDSLLMEEVPVGNMLLTEMGIDAAASGLPSGKIKVPRENITPGQLRQFRKAMTGRSVIAKGQGFDDFAELTGMASKISEEASEILKSKVPGARELSAKVSAAKDAQDILNTVNQLFERKDMKNTEQVANLIAGLEKSGIKGQSAMEIFSVLRDKALAAGNEELAKFIETKLPEIAQKYDISQTIGKSGLKTFGTLEGVGLRGAAMLGRGLAHAPEAIKQFKSGMGIPQSVGVPESIKTLMKKAAGSVPGSGAQRGIAVGRELAAQVTSKKTIASQPIKPAELSKNLYDSDNESLSSVSERLITSDNAKLQTYGKSLKEAVESGNSQLKNKVLFQISQDPNARALINR